MVGKVDKFVFSRGEHSSIFPSLFIALAMDPSKCYVVTFSWVALGKDVYIVYKLYYTQLESKTIIYLYKFFIKE
jgi:hypothetical protein